MHYSIFVYEKKGSKDREQSILLEKSLYDYCNGKGLPFAFDEKNISLGPKGKPYLENSPIHFNMSHSGKWLAIMVGDKPCGIDVQVHKKCKFMEISRRYFTQTEVLAIENKARREGIYQGEREFFRLWTEREAYGKFTGDGFFNQREIRKEDLWIHSFELKKDLYCAYCMEGMEEDVELIKKFE